MLPMILCKITICFLKSDMNMNVENGQKKTTFFCNLPSIKFSIDETQQVTIKLCF